MSDIFTKHLPHLDIHGESEATADLVIKEFINDSTTVRFCQENVKFLKYFNLFLTQL